MYKFTNYGFGSCLKRYFSVSRELYRELPTYKVAIVGTGPAGFYTTHHLFAKANAFRLHIDILEKLPAPFGLSRYGVAPDHPEVKNCEEYLINIMKNKSDPSKNSLNHEVNFFGNIDVGKDVTLKELQENYHSIVLSYGTDNDNDLKIPGAELEGVVPARQFVNWYNGHPGYSSLSTDFKPPPLERVENVTIIGNGNVALDIARILLASPKSYWSPTDIHTEAFQKLQNSSVKNVNIVARRGLLESAFTNKEIRELFEISKSEGIQFLPIEECIFKSIEPFENLLGRADKRKLALLKKYSPQRSSERHEKSWSLKFLLSPLEIKKHDQDEELVSATVFQVNQLTYDSLTGNTNIKPVEGETVVIKNELVISSIGYRGILLPGFEEIGILFDSKHNRIANIGGRILSSSDENSHGHVYKKGWYTSGWIQSGPKGVIATTMMKAFDTAENLIEDLKNEIHTNASPDSLSNFHAKLYEKEAINWAGWLKLNEHEIAEGLKKGKSRYKESITEEMLKIANK